MKVMFHDDDCGEILNKNGLCPKCGFHPDMQSTAFREATDEELRGRTALGLERRPIETSRA